MITIEQMVQREVNVCLSSLVSTLASGYGLNYSDRDAMRHGQGKELIDLTEQAFELASPIPDYEEAAIQAGFVQQGNTWRRDPGDKEAYGAEGNDETFETANELCETLGVEAYDREVYEHWSVSTWFAEKLIEQGEKVDTDFAGMNVWARTCTGQAISSDGVIERICAKMIAA